jgi:hypothetical protein
MVADSGRNGFLKAKCRKRRNFLREIVVRGSFASDGCDGQNEVAELIFLFHPATFSKE